MGVIKRGILGGFSNKVGNIVGSSWKGIATMRVLPLSVANPRTQPQVANRDAFKAATLFASSILTTMIKPLNDRFALKMSGFNLFVKRNKDYFNNPNAVEWEKLEISKGRLGVTEIKDAAEAGVDGYSVEWDKELTNGMQMETDRAYVLIVSGEGEVIGTSSGTRKRSDEYVNIYTDSQPANVRFYLQFLREDGTEVGDTSFFEI